MDRKRRPHPARHARRVVLAASTSAVVGLTGGLALHAAASTVLSSAAAATPTRSTAATNAAVSSSATAVAPTAVAHTSSHGS